ncbi:DUF6541 family protein [Saccharothrix variisporea]|uniref:4-amino-4-deoxy-L-arabinose transferase-like glycosyltransferase n=1 Tax=Saccharothrix variisporea TaxID=543527 RepID=A0A495XLM2_9PSEU|nr:DUF6541 family protein [Saccharothrix variisporea]RKT74539.1 hypothetical protein DFJ66_7899 [Saccharothrix variisporea]
MVRDLGVLAVALLVVIVPGAALAAALGVRRPLWFVGMSVPASAGLATVTAVVCAVVGVSYGPVALGVVTVVLLAVGVPRLVRACRARLAGPPTPPPWRVARVAGPVLVSAAVVLSVFTWWSGMRGLATVGQEHDMITHHLATAYIERTGRGAPWQLMPTDLLDGSDVGFYPAGLHLLMAPVAASTAGTVVGVNAVTVVVLGLVWPVSVAALGHVAAVRARLERGAPLVAGVAAVVAVGLYRPVFSLVHEGGILPNAVTLVLAPGLLAVLLTVPRRWEPVVVAGVAVAGVVAVHPSAVATVGFSLLAWWVGDAITDRRRAVRVLPRLVAVGAVAAVTSSPVLFQAMGSVAGTAGAGADIGPRPFGSALGDALGMVYSGYIPGHRGDAQWAAASATLLGAVAVLVSRRGYGVLVAWTAWLVVEVAFLSTAGRPVVAPLTGFFYHAHLRVWSHLSLFAPVLAGLGVVLVAWAVARRAARVVRRVRWSAVGFVVVAALAYLARPGIGYARVEADYVASRYARPDFVRVGPDDERAIAWLADRVRPGERVLNSANDGSTFLYVERGVPVVNVSSLGSARAPHTYRLLRDFNTFPHDDQVRRMLRELDVRWVYVDANAPTIGSGSSPENWVGHHLFSTARGLRGLDGLPGLRLAFRSGDVSVYELDLGT